jgi:hypothetical protein
MTERRPSGSGWAQVVAPVAFRAMYEHGSAWTYGKITVLSHLSDMERPGTSVPGPTWLISITRRGQRPTASDVRKALRAFSMTGAEEDNHGSGNARSFFLVVDPTLRGACECKTAESVIVEGDGYTYSVDDDPEKCGGCDMEKLRGRPCPRHSPPPAPAT